MSGIAKDRAVQLITNDFNNSSSFRYHCNLALIWTLSHLPYKTWNINSVK